MENNEILKYFEYAHLPQHLMDISQPFYNLACQMENTLPAGPEKNMAFRKLLEAKDCAVRAAL